MGTAPPHQGMHPTARLLGRTCFDRDRLLIRGGHLGDILKGGRVLLRQERPGQEGALLLRAL